MPHPLGIQELVHVGRKLQQLFEPVTEGHHNTELVLPPSRIVSSCLILPGFLRAQVKLSFLLQGLHSLMVVGRKEFVIPTIVFITVARFGDGWEDQVEEEDGKQGDNKKQEFERSECPQTSAHTTRIYTKCTFPQSWKCEREVCKAITKNKN